MESDFIGSSSPFSDLLHLSSFVTIVTCTILPASTTHHGRPSHIFTLAFAIRRCRCGSIQRRCQQFIAVRCRKPSHFHFNSSLF